MCQNSSNIFVCSNNAALNSIPAGLGLISHCVLLGNLLFIYVMLGILTELSSFPALSSSSSCIGCSQFSFCVCHFWLLCVCVICAILTINLMVCLVCLTFRRTWPKARTKPELKLKLKHILFSLMIAHKMSPRSEGETGREKWNPKKEKPNPNRNWSREKRT